MFKINDVKKLARFYYALYVRASKNSQSSTIERRYIMEKLTSDQLYKVSRILQDGHYGSFMSAVGYSLQVADSGNMEKLYKAFGDKFERVYAQALKTESNS